jgi:hypothetical protein
MFYYIEVHLLAHYIQPSVTVLLVFPELDDSEKLKDQI